MPLSLIRNGISYLGSFRLLHWGPIVTFGLVFFILYQTLANVVLNKRGRVPGVMELSWYLFSVVMLVFCYLRASFEGPGHAPTGWEPDDSANRNKLQYCKRCKGYKPPRAHHCSSCGKCSLKMDHHCPWINNCVGHNNHKMFILFLIYVVIACLHSCVLLAPYTVRGCWIVFPRMNRFPPKIVLRLYQMLMAMVLAVSLVISIGCLLFQQVGSVLENKTGIEQWIVRKAEARDRPKPFVYPYDLGYKRNIQMVFGSTIVHWLLPMQFRSKIGLSDGISYEVRPGCSAYELTEEQLIQKRLKQSRSYNAFVNTSFNTGVLDSWMCVFAMVRVFGCRTALCCPSCDEPRLSVNPGDTVLVTRDRGEWVYARTLQKRKSGDPLPIREQDSKKWSKRGWIPSGCLADPIPIALPLQPHPKTAQPQAKTTQPQAKTTQPQETQAASQAQRQAPSQARAASQAQPKGRNGSRGGELLDTCAEVKSSKVLNKASRTRRRKKSKAASS